MKIIIVRHAEPDYEKDGLTERGEIEARLLAERLCREDITAAYCSPMGRAKRTAEPTLRRLGLDAEECIWLREFDTDNKVRLPYLDRERGCWDILPYFVDERPELYSSEGWRQVDFLKGTSVGEKYDWVISEFDRVLASHGYTRSGLNYDVTDSNHKTLVFFCHFGLGAVLISHLMKCSPYSVWQHTVLAPSSVTVFNTEERIEGRALLRAACIGDTSHLYRGNMEPSFMARFCECFSDAERH